MQQHQNRLVVNHVDCHSIRQSPVFRGKKRISFVAKVRQKEENFSQGTDPTKQKTQKVLVFILQ